MAKNMLYCSDNHPKIMKLNTAGVYKGSHYTRSRKSQLEMPRNMQARACLYPVKSISSLFHTHYHLQFLPIQKSTVKQQLLKVDTLIV